MEIKINNLGQSELEIEGVLPWDQFEKFEKEALGNLGENLELPGFRKGHIPENVLMKQIPESRLLEEMAEIALAREYSKILIENKIDAIGRPEIILTKLAKGNPLEFKIKTAVLPEVKLPEYKEIAKKAEKIKEVEVGEEELEKTILQIRKLKAGKKESDEVKEEELPVLDEEFVKSLGNFSDMEDFKNKLRENILLEKNNKEREKRRIKIIEDILSEVSIDLPKILIDLELEKMIARLKNDVESAGLKFDAYLEQIKKTEDDIKKDWLDGATKKAKIELIINKISDTEKIDVASQDIEHEVSHLLEVYKDADPERAKAYVENVLRNEKVLQLLENQ